MARSALLKSLFASWASGNDSSFLTSARSIIDEERNKGHRLLARELEESLSDPRRPGAREPLSMRPVPKGRDERPLLSLTKARWTFGDLAYSSGVAAQLLDLVDENERRTQLVTHALRPRQRVLLVGPSGSGKTAAAHAIAAQLSLPVAAASLAALTSSYLGETARNIEAVIRFAEVTPCVLLLDEFDALASDRSIPGDHGELRRVVATVLQVLEGVRGESLVVATSNHPQMLDSAVWRRFDEVIRLDLPTADTISTLLRLRLNDRVGRLDLARWAGEMCGSSAAEVELITLDALRHSILENTPHVTDSHLTAAVARLTARKDALRVIEDVHDPS